MQILVSRRRRGRPQDHPRLRCRGSFGLPGRMAPWTALMLVAGLLFALQQSGLQMALRMAHASYVISVTATSIPWATLFGIVLLGERSAARTRLTAPALRCA